MIRTDVMESTPHITFDEDDAIDVPLPPTGSVLKLNDCLPVPSPVVSGTRKVGDLHPDDSECSTHCCVFAGNEKNFAMNIVSSEGEKVSLDLVNRSDVVICSFWRALHSCLERN